MKKALFIFLISCRFVTSGISQTIPPFVSANGLIGWWPFNGNADDESMNGNEGQVHGAKLTTTDLINQIKHIVLMEFTTILRLIF